jgi:hypothetical protein
MSLTPRQRQFIDSYIRHGNGQVAAVEAGYSRDRARQAAHELLSNEAVTSEIERRQTKASLADLTKGSKDITDDYVLGLIVKQISAIEEHGYGSWQVQGLARFIEMLGRYRGMFTEKLQVDLGSNIMEKLLEGRQRARLEPEAPKSLPEGVDPGPIN